MTGLERLQVSASGRNFGLDVIRATAIVLVVLDHGKHFFTFLDARLHHLTILSFFGVELFFVLSGFLIGSMLMKQLFGPSLFRLNNVFRFLARRWFRTLPNYFLVLLLNYIVYKELVTGMDIPLWKYLFFIQNLTAPVPPFFWESWSLSIEEWFYLLLPFLLWFAGRFASRQSFTFISIVSMIIGFTLIRITLAGDVSADQWNSGVRQVVIYRLDAVGYGVLLAYLWYFYSGVLLKYRSVFFMSGLLLLSISAFWYAKMNTGGLDEFIANIALFAFVSLSFALMFPMMIVLKQGSRTWIRSVITHISKISYAMYLLNYSLILVPLSSFYHPENQAKAWVFFAFFLVLNLLGASLLYHFYERPMTALRDRFHFSKSEE